MVTLYLLAVGDSEPDIWYLKLQGLRSQRIPSGTLTLLFLFRVFLQNYSKKHLKVEPLFLKSYLLVGKVPSEHFGRIKSLMCWLVAEPNAWWTTKRSQRWWGARRHWCRKSNDTWLLAPRLSLPRDMMRDGDIRTKLHLLWIWSLLGGSFHRKLFKKRFLARCPDIYNACAGIELKRGVELEKGYKWQDGPCFASKPFELASSRDGETCVTYSMFRVFS